MPLASTRPSRRRVPAPITKQGLRALLGKVGEESAPPVAVSSAADGLRDGPAPEGYTSVEHWICAACKSLNVPRAQRCYSCNMPRAQAVVGGAAVDAGKVWAPEAVTRDARTAAEAAGLTVQSTAGRAKPVPPIIPAV